MSAKQGNYAYAEKIVLFSKEEAIANFKRAQKLIFETISMLKVNESCIEIMQKNMNAVSLLRHCQRMIMQGGLENCFIKSAAIKDSVKNKELREEMMEVIKMFYK